MTDIFEYHDNYKIFASTKSILKVGNPKKCPSPKVSIIMPIYRRPEYFKRALLSVINQDFKYPYEIIIVDNNDMDGDFNENQKIVETVKSEKVLYYRNEKNLGVFGNWNRGIELSRGKYVTFCHDDDMLLKNTLTTLFELLNKTHAEGIIGNQNNIDINDNITYSPISNLKSKWDRNVPASYKYKKWNVFMSSPSNGEGCLLKRDHLINLGGFNPNYYPSADYALITKYVFEYGMHRSNFPTFNYRIGDNLSYQVFETCIDRDRFFRMCMINHMKTPSYILKKIVNANYHYSKSATYYYWTGKKSTIPVSKFNKGIIKIVNRLLHLRMIIFG